MARPQLIDACRMWCEAKGLSPIPIGQPDGLDGVLMASAISDFKGEFKDLNERQRRLIASCAK